MTFTVLSVASNPRSYDANGPKLAYKVRFTEHSDKDVEWSQNADTPPPKDGQQVDGRIDWEAKYGPKFIREFQNKISGGGGSWKPRDPKETARIQRQHSQEMALRYLAIQQARGKVPDEFNIEGLRFLIDWFQLDIESTPTPYGAFKPKNAPKPTGVSDVPADDEGFILEVREGDVPWEPAA